MARGINTTGVPSVDTITLGSGKVFLAELDANGYPKKFEDIGEVKDFSTNLSAERLDYFSARSGVRTKKKSVVTQQDATLSFTIESMNFNNLARFYSGETEVYTNPAIAGVTDSRFVEDGDVEVNGYYQLRTASGVAYGITTAHANVVETTNAPLVALVTIL